MWGKEEMSLKMKVWLGVIMYFIFVSTWPVYAQTKLAGTVGVSSSINMGEIGPSPVFKSTFTTGDRYRFENVFEFNSMDKYTRAGWSVANQVDVLIFPFDSGLFILGGADYRHRNGGSWAKDGIRVGAGLGYERDYTQFRFTVKEKVLSLNDNIDYAPYFEFLLRGDYPLGGSRWSLRAETKAEFFKYTQNSIRRTAFYSDAGIGLVYRWP